jgi:hypothetical protein
MMEMIDMREQTVKKIKKTVFVLLAVFFVVAVTAASASACTCKEKSTCKEKTTCKEKPVKEIAKPVKQVAEVKADAGLLDFVGNNCFGSCWTIVCYELDNCWDNCWNC